jgi:hypothetical protein
VVKARLDHPQQDALLIRLDRPLLMNKLATTARGCPRGRPSSLSWSTLEDLLASSSQLEEQARQAKLAICRRGFRDALKIARSSVPMRSTHWDPDPQT